MKAVAGIEPASSEARESMVFVTKQEGFLEMRLKLLFP